MLLSSGPKDEAARKRFQGRLQEMAANRGVAAGSLASVSTWADVIELDESRL
jgi:tagatose-1,6-bisphosphate aldolase